MRMKERGAHLADLRPRGNTLVAKYALAGVIPAAVLSALQLTMVGRITAPILAVDVIAAALLPFGLLSLALAFTEPVEESRPDEDDGGEKPFDDVEPPPPPGGRTFDWEQFEAEFRAYARERELVASVSE